jgi:N-acetyl sugar amidotransferase
MDSNVPDIMFDNNGICNYCSDFLEKNHIFFNQTVELKQEKLEQFVNNVKKNGNGKPYDCIVGVSGGIDSSWVLVKTVELGLRPLVVHMDNGWNSELAQNNIENLVNGLGVDLNTYVINWEEYRGLMQSFFQADVVDVELLYDNAMIAVNYRFAAKYGLKYILTGTNTTSEGMLMPKNWAWHKYDYLNIKSIAKLNNKIKIKTYPGIGTLGRIWYEIIQGFKWISFLDFLDYDKFSAVNELQLKYGFKPYPYKHYESVFTRFYQSYILPQKFNIDKRRLHLSTLIISGSLTRDEALNEMNNLPYISKEILNDDIQYFLKKMQWTQQDLNIYLSRKPVKHDKFATERTIYEMFSSIYKKLK